METEPLIKQPTSSTDQSSSPHVIHIETNEQTNYTVDTDWKVLYSSNFRILNCFRIAIIHLRHANYSINCQWMSSIIARNQVLNEEYIPQKTPKCFVGPHWWLMCIAYFGLIYIFIGIFLISIHSTNVTEVIIGTVFTILTLVMYAQVACTDPGIVKQLDEPPDDTYTYCEYCCSYRPETARHCIDCQVCVDGHDHHCPWTGKCIGKGNINAFYRWLLFLIVSLVYVVIQFAAYMLPQDNGIPNNYESADGDDDLFR